MAFDFTLISQETSYFQGNMPSADAIYNALASITLPNSTHWVSSVPRIGRTLGVLSNVTTVTWVLEVEGPLTQDQATATADNVASLMTGALYGVSHDFSTARAYPFDSNRDGPLSDWQAGTAATPTSNPLAIEQAQQTAEGIQQSVQNLPANVGSFFGNAAANAIKPLGISGPVILLTAAGAVVLVGVIASGAARPRRNPITQRVLRRSS